MKNVSEILSKGESDRNNTPWYNMRNAWRSNDERRDAGLEYPGNVFQIKNLDYKKPVNGERYIQAINNCIKLYQENKLPVRYYGEKTDAYSLESPEYPRNSLLDIYIPQEVYTTKNEHTTQNGSDSQDEHTTQKVNDSQDEHIPQQVSAYSDVKSDKNPVIVNVHGGGWFYGDKELYSHYCADLARRGFVVVSFNYGLAPEKPYPAGIFDVCALITFLYENAEIFGIDMEKFFMMGDSAGAQLTVNYCIIAGDKKYREALNPPRMIDGLLPLAVCLNCGAYRMSEKDGELVDWYMGGQRKSLASEKDDSEACTLNREQRELFENQLEYINDSFPQAYLMYSANDDLGYHTPDLARIFDRTGVPYKIKEYGQEDKSLGHVFHIDINKEAAKVCNDEECRFLREAWN
jgi:acetyl esterase/lipase